MRSNIGGDVKVLLTDITKDGEEFRDHLWADYKELVKYIPKTNRYKKAIEFIAKEYKYFSRTGGDVGLKQIKIKDKK
jgi:hypothetical protein